MNQLLQLTLIVVVSLLFSQTSIASWNKESLREALGVQKSTLPQDIMLNRGISDSSRLKIVYQGISYPAILLPDGTKAPAILKNNTRKPACLDVAGKLVPARYDDKEKALVCSSTNTQNFILQENKTGAVVYTEAPVQEQPKPAPRDQEKPAPRDQEKVDKKPAPRVKKEPKKKPTSRQKPDRKSAPKKSTSRSASIKPAPKRKPEKNVYRGLALQASGSQTAFVTLSQDDAEFGVSRGTYASGKLERTINSSENSPIEIVLTEAIEGSYRDLPASTILEGNVSYNQATRLAEITIYLAILPNKEEKRINATIMRTNRQAGLAGQLDINLAEVAVDSGKINAATQIIGSAVDSTGVANKTLSSVAGDVDTTQRKRRKDLSPSLIVSPQKVMIRFNEAF